MQDRKKFFYLRLSQEDSEVARGREKESMSIQFQRYCIKSYIEDHPDIGYCAEFEEIVDDGYSGTTFQRPGIRKLIQLVEAGMVDTIIVKDLSRFARNYLEAGHYIEYVFPAFQVRFISINDHYDSIAMGESTAGFSFAIHNLINQLYSRDISRKIKSVIDMKKLNGEYCYGAVPYGYKKGAKHNTIEIDPPAAQTVRQIFEWAYSGVTVTQIAARLNEMGVQTPSEYLKAVRGNCRTSQYWSFESVRNILINRIYTGDTIPFKSHVTGVGSSRVKLLSEEDQIVIPDTHKAIVSREVFSKAQTVIKGHTKKNPPTSGSLLSAYVICGCCGKKLQKGRAGNRIFKCVTSRYAPNAPCGGVSIQEKALSDILLHAIKRECAIADEKLPAVRAAAKSSEAERIALQKEITEERRNLEKSKAAALRLYEEFVSGRLNKESYQSARIKEKEREAMSSLQINLLSQKLTALDRKSRAAAAKENMAAMTEYREIEELSPALLQHLLKSVEVYPGGAITISWKFRDGMA